MERLRVCPRLRHCLNGFGAEFPAEPRDSTLNRELAATTAMPRVVCDATAGGGREGPDFFTLPRFHVRSMMSPPGRRPAPPCGSLSRPAPVVPGDSRSTVSNTESLKHCFGPSFTCLFSFAGLEWDCPDAPHPPSPERKRRAPEHMTNSTPPHPGPLSFLPAW